MVRPGPKLRESSGFVAYLTLPDAFAFRLPCRRSQARRGSVSESRGGARRAGNLRARRRLRRGCTRGTAQTWSRRRRATRPLCLRRMPYGIYALPPRRDFEGSKRIPVRREAGERTTRRLRSAAPRRGNWLRLPGNPPPSRQLRPSPSEAGVRGIGRGLRPTPTLRPPLSSLPLLGLHRTLHSPSVV